MRSIAGPTLPDSDAEREAWLARYVAGTLPDSDAERVEAYWAEHPELTDELERASRVADGLHGLRARGELGAAVRGSWWSNRLSLFAVAAGGATLAAGLLGWWMTTARPALPIADSLASLATETRPHALMATVSVLRLRTAGADATLERPAAGGAVAIRVLPEDGGAGPYRLRVHGIDGAAANCAAGEFDGLYAADDGFFTAYVPASALCAGRYALEVHGPAEAPPSTFTLDVRTDPTP
jgi:hypothetical protein